MGIFQRLFGSSRVSLEELQRALPAVERERRRRSLRLRKLETRRSDVVDRIRAARSAGRSLEVDYLWEELRQLKVESAIGYREAKVANLEALGLKRYIHGLERLRALKDEKGARRLIERIRRSRLDDKLTGQTIREEEYLRELETILDDAGVELGLDEAAEVDPEKARFLEEIDAINRSESQGDSEGAQERKETLQKRLREQAERGEAG